jgi:hypothetical protein
VWSGARRRAVGVALVLASGAAAIGCHRKHVPVDAGPELGYPTCPASPGSATALAQAGRDARDAGEDRDAASAGDPGQLEGEGHLRAGPTSAEKNVVETFTLHRTLCGHVFRGRQEWPLAIADVEVHYDARFTPIWAWKRLTMAGSRREDGNADVRRYELRTGDVFIKHRDDKGDVTLEKLLPGGRMNVPAGAKVGAVVGPGRGIITAWIRHEKLPVGGKTQELVLDFRDMIESLEEGTLERMPDLYEPSLGKKVRVYTFFGKETVFADDTDTVIGDLAGMRPSASLDTPEPPPLPTFGGPDPVHTP